MERKQFLRSLGAGAAFALTFPCLQGCSKDDAPDGNVVEEPTKRKHPVAKTKFEAISWNIKHTMWHCGQIACIKRLIHGGFDFGLTNRN